MTSENIESRRACLKRIEALARTFYRQQDAYHNEQHGERVVAYALRINKVEQADPFLVEAGAWLHQFHDHLDELERLLEKTGLPANLQKHLYEIVRLCRPHKISEKAPLVARVVFDADAMELIGAYGIIRELSCNLTVRKKPLEQAVKETREVQNLFYQAMTTATGRSLAFEAMKVSELFWSDYLRSEKP